MAFHGFLKQSTATTLLLGPFVNNTDGHTPESGLTLSQADILLWKEGGTTLAQKNDTTSCTHRSNGCYTCPINSTDTATLGMLSVSVAESGALQVRQDYCVVQASTFDALVTNGLMSLTSTAMTESYAADGSTASIAQLLYMIYGLLGEHSTTDLTLTVKKLDGSTSAATFTHNDSLNPTAITRAT